MSFDFSLDRETDELRGRVRAFVDERLIPLESDRASYDEFENVSLGLLEQLRGETKKIGIWAPQVPLAEGGMGLRFVAQAVLYEEMNRSIFGPAAFNAAAPDDGNMRLLATAGTPYQRERWLRPIVDGTVRSSFCMTEPDGCGSDPSLTYTTAERAGGGWRIRGRKWYATGAGIARHFIVIARTSGDQRKGLSAFLFDRDAPGWELVRRIAIMGPEEHGGHGELVFDGLFVPDRDVLLEIGDGLKVTQMRLGPARLTHCMRWLGLARRSLEIAAAAVKGRIAFGSALAEHESVQTMLGSAAQDVETGRLLVMLAAWKLDRGERARKEISMAKNHVAETLHRAVDTALQLSGARGYSKDTILEWIYRYARQARLVDGASEVHRMVIAREFLNAPEGFWAWEAPR
jgi:acyl-CoA dehydrogenase